MDGSSLHALLLLSDSALPLGSFAFSSGLESYLAHHKHTTTKATASQDFDAFLDMSLRNLASTSLPYVLEAYHSPTQLLSLDNDMDASTPCTVARRASVAQGKALLQLWERALAPAAAATSLASQASITEVTSFIASLKTARPDAYGLQLNAHFAPLFGVVCRALELGADQTAYLFLLNHAKAVLSAAVRASVFGPYQSHAVLASRGLQERIKACVDREKGTCVRDAGLTVPPMDIWLGRHELLYSRIFNS